MTKLIGFIKIVIIVFSISSCVSQEKQSAYCLEKKISTEYNYGYSYYILIDSDEFNFEENIKRQLVDVFTSVNVNKDVVGALSSDDEGKYLDDTYTLVLSSQKYDSIEIVVEKLNYGDFIGISVMSYSPI